MASDSQKSRPLVSILIPAYNEASTFEALFDRVQAKEIEGCNKEIIIIESASTDGTREMVQKRDKEPGVRAIYQERAKGKGAALKEGFKAARGDYILIQDADLEYDVNDYDILLEPLMKNHADFVLGSRHMGAGSWKIRKFDSHIKTSFLMNFGDWLFKTLFNVLYGVTLTDPTTMFKVFKRKCLTGIEFESDRFDLDWEIVGRFIRRGYPPLEVPVSYNARHFEDGKKINVYRDPWLWIWVIFKFAFKKA